MNDKPPLPHVLVLNGARYRLEEVLQQAKLAPVVTIKYEELNPIGDGQLPECVVTYEPPLPQMGDNGVLFYKQHGKYTVLSGANRIEQARAEKHYKGEHIGRLLSSMVMKKTRVEVPEPVREVRPANPVLNQRPYFSGNQRDSGYPPPRNYNQAR